MTTSDVVLEVESLFKTFRVGFWRKRVEAVKGVTFTVHRGEIFGLLGPNGAGKTTTIKSVLGLIFPTRGSVKIFGIEGHRPDNARRLGYLPENPYVYQYLKPLEFLDLCGQLVGMSRADRARSSEAMIDKVGLRHAVDRPIGKFSKGMMQRIGLAQALLHDPELLILDEPMSGLDPVGRKEVRDLLLEQRTRGKTLIFTSHILTDVERICDRVAIVHQGKMTAYGRLNELLRQEVQRVEIEIDAVSDALRNELSQFGDVSSGRGTHVRLRVEGDETVPDILKRTLAQGGKIIAMSPQRETLEDLFVRDIATTVES
jgi:ABC-2 type transport system ATP-binding protein